MIGYIAQNKKMMTLMSYFGVALFLVSALIGTEQNPPTAKAETCSASYPVVQSGYSYATKWDVGAWLGYGTIPIGPSYWAVFGRVKQGTTETCFREAWILKKVVFQSSNGSEPMRGAVLSPGSNGTSIADESGTKLNFNIDAYSETSKTLPAKCVGGIYFVGSCTGVSFPGGTYNFDNAFGGSNTLWANVGPYGLLRNSSGNLVESRGYTPKEWQIDGRL